MSRSRRIRYRPWTASRRASRTPARPLRRPIRGSSTSPP
jgi:hypothetical protein